MMQRLRVLALTKPPRILSVLQNEAALSYRLTKSPTLVTPYFALPPLMIQTMHLSRTTAVAVTDEIKPGFFKQMWKNFDFFDTGKYKRKAMGYFLYEDLTVNVQFTNFFADYKMPDTFYSWFVVMELHIWMLMARYMAEGKHGQEIRNSIVEAMWADMNKRKGKLKDVNFIAVNKQGKELSQQFNAAIIGYDEGIMSDDKVLAGAIWRRMFQCECNNPEYLEQLVIYVRKQINELDKVPSEEILKKKSTQWIDYRKP